MTRSKISTSSTKFVYFERIRKPRWQPWPLIGWDTFVFFFSSLKPLIGIQRNLTRSKISKSSTKLVLFGQIGKQRWSPWSLIGWDIFVFFSETAERNLTKLDRRQVLNIIISRNMCFIPKWSTRVHCYVAFCNNYAMCNTLQTALNCNAVCNTSYFKLRCDGNAICNVLQIASKFYHLKILKRRKKLINYKMHRFNNILLWIQLDTNLFELSMQNSQWTLHFKLVRTLFCPRALRNLGGIKTIRPSVYWFVCLSLCLSQKL